MNQFIKSAQIGRDGLILCVAFVFGLASLKPSLVLAAGEPLFDRTLSRGMQGEDVRRLQIILNIGQNTRVAPNGPGAPGEESGYFGEMTRQAVIRFQEARFETILKPNLLVKGTGVVGPSTRQALNAILLAENGSDSTVKSRPASNPNLENIDIFLSAVDAEAKKRKIGESELAAIKKQITIDAATTTDLMAAFTKLVQGKPVSSSSIRPAVSIRDAVVNFILKTVNPGRASAQSIDGSIPFGGQLYYSFYCSCSQNWLLTIQPLPPSFATLLTYMTGSQAYLSYNLPFSRYLLGKYSSGGQCTVYVGTGCASVPSQGAITPTVGSSAI